MSDTRITRKVEMLPVYKKVSKRLLADPTLQLKAAFHEAGLTVSKDYTHFWLLHRRAEIMRDNPNHVFPANPTKQAVAKMRDVQNMSWGEIACRFGEGDYGTPESRISKIYSEATGKHREGSRIGHGGRWLGGQEYHEALYRGEAQDGTPRQQIGTTAELSEKWEAVVAAILAERDAETKVRKATTKAEKAQAQTAAAKAKAKVKVATQAHAAAQELPAGDAPAKAKRPARKVAA